MWFLIASLAFDKFHGLLFPTDPAQWTEDHTYRWAEWTVKEFNLNSIDLNRLRGISGHRLCALTSRDFLELAYIKEHGQTLQHCFGRIKGLGKLSSSFSCSNSVDY